MTSLGTVSSKEELRIFVGGLSRDTTKQHLEDAFGRFGKVVEAQVKHKAAIGNTMDGHKRAQFSFKPMSSRLLPTTDISSLNHIEDPEEYFLAFERLEIADKGLKRLRGEVATDLTQHQPLRTARSHRAGILGRSLPTIDFSVLDDIKDPEEYFSKFEQLEIADEELKRLSGEVATDLTQHQRSRTARERRPGILGKRFHFTPSTDLIEPLSKTPSNTSSVAGSIVNLHPEATEELGTVFDAMDREGSVPDKDEPTVDLLGDLLSAFKTMDADAANAYLRKKLEVKSIDVSKMHPPEFYSTQRNDHRTLGNEVTNESDGPRLPDMPSSHVGSRLAAIPNLQSRISMINPSEDIQMHLPVLEADKTIHSKTTSEVELTKPCFHENHTDNNSSRFDNHGHDASTGFDDSLEEEGNDKPSDAVIFVQPNPEVEDPRSGYMKQNDTESLASTTISSSGHDINSGSVGLHAILQSEVNVVAEGEPVSGAEVSKNNSSPSKSVLPVDWHSENLCILPEENVETQRLPEDAGASQNRGHKMRVPKTGQNKPQSTSKRQKLTLRRQSIADAGLTWKSGVRRSTRIKSRPLEYWRGERFLYGRIHDSLATVIGVKYASPRQDGKAQVLKVKSFVPDKYAHLVTQAAAT